MRQKAKQLSRGFTMIATLLLLLLLSGIAIGMLMMVSTEGTHAKVLDAVERGASGYVRKPFTADQIKEKLATLL